MTRPTCAEGLVHRAVQAGAACVLRPFLQLFHRGEVTGLDLALRRPVAATCGVDGTLRIWNYGAHQPQGWDPS